MSTNERKRQRRRETERKMISRRKLTGSNVVILSDRDMDIFLNMSEEPNEALKKAAKEYKEMKERGEIESED